MQTKINQNDLMFTFPEIHENAKLTISFKKTLRIPVDDKQYPLTPDLGNFPLEYIKNYKISDEVNKRNGVMLPISQSEAMYVSFSSIYPFAVKIAAGKRSAITGKEWCEGLRKDDYCVSPTQRWIDGFMAEDGNIQQFIAAIGGQGFTSEEQLTNKFEFGGLQIEVYPMKKEEYEKLTRNLRNIRSLSPSSFGPQNYSCDLTSIDSLNEEEKTNGCIPVAASCISDSGDFSLISENPYKEKSVVRSRSLSVKSLGMAAGGNMKQKILEDNFGFHVWDREHVQRTFVHMFSYDAWETITGKRPQIAQLDSSLYERYRIPWFDHYDSGKSMSNPNKLKTVEEIAKEKGYSILGSNESLPVGKEMIKGLDGEW